jgi:hypothetical protein
MATSKKATPRKKAAPQKPSANKTAPKAAKPVKKAAAKKAVPQQPATVATSLLQFPFSLLPSELAAFRGAVIHAAAELKSVFEQAGIPTDLFHNHDEEEAGKRLIRQPLIAYQLPELAEKADRTDNGQGFPCLSGAGAGAAAIALLAANMPRQLRIYNRRFTTTGFTLQQQQLPVQPQQTWAEYALHQWLALNPNNHSRYLADNRFAHRVQLLQEVLTKNIQGWYQAAGHPHAAGQVQLYLTEITRIQHRPSGQVGRKMLLFDAGFACNMALPPGMALGNAAAKGFGVVQPL